MHAACLPSWACDAREQSAAEGAGVIPPSCRVEQAMCTLCSTAVSTRARQMPARQAQGRPWGCGGGVTVLDAVERCGACMSCAWCNRARTRIEIRSPTSPRCLKRCNCKLRRPCHDRFKLCSVSRPSSLRSEGSCSVAVTCVSCECVRPSSLVLVLAGPNLSRVFEPARPSTSSDTSHMYSTVWFPPS